MGRFAPRIAGVSVRLEDRNGPKGGVDKACRISVDLGGAGVVLAEDVDTVMEAAVGRAAECAGRSVARALERAGPRRAPPAQRPRAVTQLNPRRIQTWARPGFTPASPPSLR